MKRSKRFLALLTIVLMFSLVITACGGTKTEEPKSAEEQQPAEQKSAYPEKEVTFVCPWPAGGSSDLIVRTMSKGLGDELPVPFVVVNREGANGIIATSELQKAAPDGYTISLGTNGLFTSQLPEVLITYG